MTDNVPPDIQESARIFSAWTAANPGQIPPADIHAHALKVQSHLRAQGWNGNVAPTSAVTRVESAVDQFKHLIREDTPPQHPAWRDPRPSNNSQPREERAGDRFMRLRSSNIDQSKMPKWRDPRSA